MRETGLSPLVRGRAVLRRHRIRCVSNRLTVLILLSCCLVLPRWAAAVDSIDFRHHVAPLLETHCLGCHSENIAKGELSLASRDQLFENGYVVPGDPEGSYLLELIAGVNGEPPEMPQEAEPLSAEAVAVIRNWIAAGADWPEDVTLEERSQADLSWWSLQPLTDVEPPAATATVSGWADHPIDRFLAAALTEKDLVPNPPADRRTLIRRASYDLTGLPPTPEEVAAFVADTDPRAYEKLIDRLLASPHYGERWGRHWLDLARYAESTGGGRSSVLANAWRYRNYVIGAFNDDMPYGQFITEQIAGDLLPRTSAAARERQLVATAFLALGPKNLDLQDKELLRMNTRWLPYWRTPAMPTWPRMASLTRGILTTTSISWSRPNSYHFWACPL